MLDRAYRAWLAQLSLSGEHAHALAKRGIGRELARRALLRTLPLDGRKALGEAVVRAVGDAAAGGVPGLHLVQQGTRSWWSAGGAPGLLIPVTDAAGRVVSLRVRGDGGARYTYVSSTSHGGPSAVTATYVPPWDGPATGDLRVTEGELKSLVIQARTGLRTVAVPGVGHQHDVMATIQALGATRVRLAMDADSAPRTRALVSAYVARLARALGDVVGFAHVGIETWPETAGKGLDDVLAAGHGDQVMCAWGSGPTAAERPPRVQAIRRAVVGPPPIELAAAQGAILQAIAGVTTLVTLVRTPCGSGKTTAAVTHAAARATTTHRSPDATSDRPPLHSQTAVVVPTHAMVDQVEAAVRATGTPVKVLISPLSYQDESGEYGCAYRAAGLALATGGQSTTLALCEGRSADGGVAYCDHYATCRARLGYRGDADARVIVTVHALMRRASDAVGPTGLVVLDETPRALEKHAWSLSDLASTVATLSAFGSRYAAALAPPLLALQAWATDPAVQASPLPPTELDTVVVDYLPRVPVGVCEAAMKATGGTTLHKAVHAARSPGQEHLPPPLRKQNLLRARHDVTMATILGRASGVLGSIESALVHDVRAVVRLEPAGDSYKVLLTTANTMLFNTLSRAGPTVVTDATIDLVAPVYAKILGYEPPLVWLNLTDHSPVERVHLRTRGATRARWLDATGTPAWDAILPALRRVAAWLHEQPETRTVGLFAYKTIAEAITHNAAPAVVREILAAWDVRPGWYGNLRGRNDWIDVDAVVTLGDPRDNVGDVRHDAAYLDLPPTDDRVRDLARAELEQAHGRLRAACRTRPGRALHLGEIVPGGWYDYQERDVGDGGPIPTPPAMSAQELRAARAKLGVTVREFATRLGICPRAAENYLSGCRPIPADVAEKALIP